MNGNSRSVYCSRPQVDNLTAAAGVIVLDAERVEFRAFCCGGGGGCDPAVAESSAAVADVAGLTGGRREQDPSAVLAAVRRCVNDTVAAGGWVAGVHARMMAARVVAVAVLNRHRGSVVAWNRCTGTPLSNVILWTDDRAVAARGQSSVASDTGVSTIKRLIDSNAAVRLAHHDGNCLFGTVDAWIVWNLTGGANGGVNATDPSVNVVFTSLTKNSPPEWKVEQLAVLGISPESLPKIKSTYELYGYFCDGPLRHTPISGVVGNQQPSVNGQCRLESGTATNAFTVAENRSLPTDDDRPDKGPVNASERQTSTVRKSTESTSAREEIEGDRSGFNSKVPPAFFVPTLAGLCVAQRRPEPVFAKMENRVSIVKDGDDDEKVVQTSASIPLADVPEADPPRPSTSANGPKHDDSDMREAFDDIASEKPSNKKWTVSVTVAAIGVGALLVLGGYKWLTH